MKVLMAHNYYRSLAHSGEDAVFHNEIQILRQNNNHVETYIRKNDYIDDSNIYARIKLGLETAWSKTSYVEIVRFIRKYRPDVAHFHNTFPLITPSAWAACQDNGVPVVQTIHNYRFTCPGALLQRNGQPCELCLGHAPIKSLIYRCYRDSFLATLAQVLMISYNQKKNSFKKLVNRYIALTDFAKTRLIEANFPLNKIEIKPNFIPQPPEYNVDRDNYAVFAGRLSQEKGVRTLIESWRTVKNLKLKILGDGPIRSELETRSTTHGLDIEFHGYCSSEVVLDTVKKALFSIIPSECYEGFPMVVLEAYGCGTPVIASKIGSLAEIVLDNETGLHFEAGNARDLADKVNVMLSSPDTAGRMGERARQVFEEKYTAEKNYEMLMGIYERAIEDFKLSKRNHG